MLSAGCMQSPRGAVPASPGLQSLWSGASWVTQWSENELGAPITEGAGDLPTPLTSKRDAQPCPQAASTAYSCHRSSTYEGFTADLTCSMDTDYKTGKDASVRESCCAAPKLKCLRLVGKDRSLKEIQHGHIKKWVIWSGQLFAAPSLLKTVLA